MSGEIDAVIYLSRSAVEAAINEYGKLNTLISGCDTKIEAANLKQNEANWGNAEDARFDRTVQFLTDEYSDLEKHLEHMTTSLQTVSLTAKSLAGMCEDFLTVLEEGAPLYTDLKNYECVESSEDVVLYDQTFCKEGSYSGDIDDNTTEIKEQTDLQSDNLTSIEEKIGSLKIMSVSVSSYISDLRDNIKKENYVEPLYEQLKRYCAGVSSLNADTQANMALYTYSPDARFHVRTYAYDGEATENLAYINKILQERLEPFNIPDATLQA